MTLELVRLCRTCGERPSGRYFNCKRCRENDYKKPCPEEGCSNLKSRNSKRCAECRGKLRGPDHPAWRGGRIEGGDGYIRVYVPDHPKANMGRYIHGAYACHGAGARATSAIHHKNGNRGDNRLENLELWLSSQPSGQRVTDLLAWANEIIEQYGHEELFAA